VPIIAVTAYPMSLTRVRAFSQGCSGYVEKPIDFPTLNGLIEKHLP
jgi:CheY-like chemotaxis protein